MASANWKDAALVLVGHGSTLNGDSCAPTYQHADTLRRRGCFGQVLECFWKVEPGVSAIWRQVWTDRVFIVPVFISDGYFTEEVLPRELGLRAVGAPGFDRVQQRAGKRVYYCGAVGTHESMTRVLTGRALEAVESAPGAEGPPRESEMTLFIAGHGTGNNENSRKAIERQVELIRGQGRYAGVHAVFMEEEPRIESCYALSGTRDLVVVPFFISDGLHSYEDIPVMLGEAGEAVRERLRRGEPTWLNPTERLGRRIWYTRSIGSEPHLADVILDRVRDLDDGRVV